MSSAVIAPPRSSPLDAAERTEPSHLRSRSRARSVSAHIYLPACTIAVVAVVLVAIGWAAGWGRFDFAGSDTALRAVVAGPATLAILGVFLVVERVWPAQRRSIVARGYRHDLLFAVVNVIVVVPLITALTLGFLHIVETQMPWIVLPQMGALPRAAAVGLIVVAMDGCNWAVHLANHRARMLWRFHELHHSQEDLNVLSVFRTHPLIHVSYLVALIPGVVLMANGAMTITVLVVYGAIVAFAHSNTRLGFGPLERVLVSPNYHRIHHMLDGPADVNLGFALTIWDQLFRRAVFPTADTVRTDTGLAGRPLVVEQEGPRARHFAVFAAQMVAPFRPVRGAADAPPVRSRAHAAGGQER